MNLKSEIKVAVFAINAAGDEDCLTFTLTMSEQDIENGQHLDKAKEDAIEAGYEAPFFVFDEHSPVVQRLGDLKNWIDPNA